MLIRRTLIWGIVVLALLGVSLPGLIGWIAAARIDDIAARLARPGLIRVTHVDFDRGWFVSHARIRLQLTGALCNRPPCPALTLDSRLHQGPIAYGLSGVQASHVGWAVIVTHVDPARLWPHRRFVPALAPLRVVTRVTPDTRFRSRLDWPGGSFRLSQDSQMQASLTSKPMHAIWTSGLLGRGITAFDLSWPAFSFLPEQGGRLAWRGLQVQLPSASAPVPAAGDGRLHADSFILDNGRGHAARLRSLSADGAARAVNGRWHGHITIAADGVDGIPGVRGPLRIRAALRRVDWAVWARLPRMGSALGDSPGAALDDVRLYRRLLPRLLAGGTTVAIDRFTLATDDGPLRASLHIRAPQTLRPVTMAADAISQLEVALTVRLPAKLLRRAVRRRLVERGAAPGAIDAARIDYAVADLVARGLIAPIAGASAYRVVLRIHRGRLTLNGHGEPGWRNLIDQVQAAAPGL